MIDPRSAEPAELYGLLSGSRRFLFDARDRVARSGLLKRWDSDSSPSIVEANSAMEGAIRFFSGREAPFFRSRKWNQNAFSGAEVPADRHWSDLGDFDFGDIKYIWEPSRFGIAYALVRAYWRSGDRRYADFFWTILESWRSANPPQLGPNWKCGQETSIRIMAWCFALWGFLDCEATTPGRVAMLVEMLAVSGRRVEANLSYAINQQNNHGISEAAGLFTLGVLFPEMRIAAHWRDVGSSVLARLAKELVYDDGGFSQHSLNYHRHMLHCFTWAVKLGDVRTSPLAPIVKDRLARAVEFELAVQDPHTGAVSKIGPDDGSLVLPLTNCGYEDFRPGIQLASALTGNGRVYDEGPWDEALFWIAGDEPVGGHVRATTESFSGDESGVYTIRNDDGLAVFRCMRKFRHRPAHADLLNVDIWWRGSNVAIDAGTFSYNDPRSPALDFEGTRTHNTVSVDGADQMQRASRFLWAPWARGWVKADGKSGDIPYLEGSHDGYQRLDSQLRVVRALALIQPDVWIIADEVNGSRAHDVALHWLIGDFPFQASVRGNEFGLTTPNGPYGIALWSSSDGTATAVRAGPDRGWRAPRYGMLEPAISIGLASAATTSVRFLSAFGPGALRWDERENGNVVLVRDESPLVEVCFRQAPDRLIGFRPR
jgi:asparagine synthase (glutamine-hydrolysing)